MPHLDTHPLVATLVSLLEEARARTMLLVAPLDDEDLRVQHDPLMSPIVWDLGHINHFEALWLTRNLDGPIEFSEMPGMFNPFEYPRKTRAALPLPALDVIADSMAVTRERVLERMQTVDFEGDNPLTHDGYVYRMVLQHEYQHNETILQTLQLKKGAPYAAPRAWELPAPRLDLKPGAMVRFAGGTVDIGTDDRSAAYDNERPRHTVAIDPFWIDATPVTNEQYLDFMEVGGAYQYEEYWSKAGLAWLKEAKVTSPKHWFHHNGEWWHRTMDRTEPLPLDHPVVHVCYYEAEAFANWVHKRLPTEQEWEAAASCDSRTGASRAFPWGDEPVTRELANVDQLGFGTAPVGAYPRNVSPCGAYGMIGDVWEWTSSDFRGYPGFHAFPYKEYSEVFFGREYKVLRGGSWATRPGAIRNSFRNWDYPIRRQIFAGFRCARDD